MAQVQPEDPRRGRTAGIARGRPQPRRTRCSLEVDIDTDRAMVGAPLGRPDEGIVRALHRGRRREDVVDPPPAVPLARSAPLPPPRCSGQPLLRQTQHRPRCHSADQTLGGARIPGSAHNRVSRGFLYSSPCLATPRRMKHVTLVIHSMHGRAAACLVLRAAATRTEIVAADSGTARGLSSLGVRRRTHRGD